MRPTLSLFVRPVLAALISLGVTSYLAYGIAKPHIIVVNTYGRQMPWEAFLTTAKSPYHETLAKMFSDWIRADTDLPQTVTQGLEIKRFDWLDWYQPTWLAVEEARRSFKDSPLFKEPNGLELSLKQDYQQQVTRTDSRIHFSATPEREETQEKDRLKNLGEALKQRFASSFPNTPVPEFESVYYTDYERLLEGLARGEIDVALCSPFSAFTLRHGVNETRDGSEVENVIRLAQGKKGGKDEPSEAGYQVILICSDDNDSDPIPGKIQDYEFIYASKISTSGYLIPLRMLNGLGVSVDPSADQFYPFKPEQFSRFRLKISEHKFGNHDKVIDYVQSHHNIIAGVPSDKFNPRLQAVRGHSIDGALIGASIGALVIIVVRIFVPTTYRRRPWSWL